MDGPSSSSSPPTPSSPPAGNTLGGGGSGGGGASLTPAEIRQRRLAALERNSPPTKKTATSPSQAAAAAARQQQSKISTSGTLPTAASSSSSSSPAASTAATEPPVPSTAATATAAVAATTTAPDPMDISNTTTTASSMDAWTTPPRNNDNTRNNNNNNNIITIDDDDDEDDEDLQRALALSLAGDTTDEEDDDDDDDEPTPEKHLEQVLHVSDNNNSNNNNNNNKHQSNNANNSTTPAVNPMIKIMTTTTETHKKAIISTQNYSTIMSPCNTLDFHYIMWDAGITTEHDQLRWLSQGIQFKNITHAERSTPTATSTANGSSSNNNNNNNVDSLLAAILLHYESWGLTQSHGGPCGVLAAIQAEMLRLLLFGPRTSSSSFLEYPTQVTNHFVTAPPDLSPPLLRRALAMAMSLIWARASMAASAANTDGDVGNGGGSMTTTTSPLENNTTASTNNNNPSVKIVLPKLAIQSSSLEWHHLEPWSSDTGGSGQSDHLVTFTISLHDENNKNNNNNGNGVDNNNTNDNNGGGIDNPQQQQNQHQQEHQEQPHTKRPRKSSRTVEQLAEKTADFLIDTNALEWFQRPGGVLLMVMTLATSRGIPNVQGDMDDPTAKLTSNFGHCSQELINLLLTGQAVSNVFDNTMRPSGELICRGIQARPEIGYLSQLESMRYLEVGGYYKTPNFPIWVVGSTSHFTVMFGDAACLQESLSDVLLEKVRRAFKSIDENENGFIQTQQLNQFLTQVDLVPGIVSEHAIPTLAATMEVHGAGIILWEDLWKRTSRLLTGASLETVLEWDGDSLVGTAFVPAPAPPPPPPPPPSSSAVTDSMEGLSDEELARRLQAEWNGEVFTPPAPPAPPVPAPPPAAPKPETYGKTFQLYHYNGLRGGALKPFRVTRLTADEAIGASVSLGAASQSSHHHMMMAATAGDLEDVLRSKWPSCKINWLGTAPPSID